MEKLCGQHLLAVEQNILDNFWARNPITLFTRAKMIADFEIFRLYVQGPFLDKE